VFTSAALIALFIRLGGEEQRGEARPLYIPALFFCPHAIPSHPILSSVEPTARPRQARFYINDPTMADAPHRYWQTRPNDAVTSLHRPTLSKLSARLQKEGRRYRKETHACTVWRSRCERWVGTVHCDVGRTRLCLDAADLSMRRKYHVPSGRMSRCPWSWWDPSSVRMSP
jgi:hypothetical protein